MENKEDKKAKEPITGVIDPELINIHMEAASKDDSRRAIKCLLIRHEAGRLHIITTNGRMLLHTTMPDMDAQLDTAPDFEIMVEVTRKLKKKKNIHHVTFEIAGDKVFFRGFGTFDAFEICTDCKYPDIKDIERNDKARKPLTEYKAIAPWLLDIVHRYVGEHNYAQPDVMFEGGDACYFTALKDGELRLAIVMPLREV